MHGLLRDPSNAAAKAWEHPDRKEFSRGRRITDLLRGFRLLSGHALIPIKKLFQRAAMIQVIEERLRWDTRSLENQRTAHNLRVLRENVGQIIRTFHAYIMLLLGR